MTFLEIHDIFAFILYLDMNNFIKDVGGWVFLVGDMTSFALLHPFSAYPKDAGNLPV